MKILGMHMENFAEAKVSKLQHGLQNKNIYTHYVLLLYLVLKFLDQKCFFYASSSGLEAVTESPSALSGISTILLIKIQERYYL